MGAKSLQIATIIEVLGSVIRVKHPDISGNIRTFMTAPLTAAGTTLTVADNNGFADNDYFLLGEVGDTKTEECDVNGAVTRGTSMTITNSTKFSHEVNCPVTKINERLIKIYGASSDGGTGTVVASTSSGIGIQWNRLYTEITLATTDTAYDYYYAVFYDGTTTSDAGDYVNATGLANTTALEMIQAALKEVNADVDGSLITWDWLLDLVNDWQDEVTHFVLPDNTTKNWSFEIFEDTTSIAVTQNEYQYALSGLSSTLKYPKTVEGILSVKLGPNVLDYVDHDQIETDYDGMKTTTVATAASAGDTSIVLTSTIELADDGTVYIGADTVTYDTNTTATNTLSGIPASGTGAITDTQAVGTVVWQGVSPGTADKYSVFNGYIQLNQPVEEDIVGYILKVRAYKALDRLSALSENTSITFPYLAKYYIGSRIEARKNNKENSQNLLNLFYLKLSQEAQRDQSPVEEEFTYYNFSQ